jgi:hypothetical protein
MPRRLVSRWATCGLVVIVVLFSVGELRAVEFTSAATEEMTRLKDNYKKAGRIALRR